LELIRLDLKLVNPISLIKGAKLNSYFAFKGQRELDGCE